MKWKYSNHYFIDEFDIIGLINNCLLINLHFLPHD